MSRSRDASLGQRLGLRVGGHECLSGLACSRRPVATCPASASSQTKASSWVVKPGGLSFTSVTETRSRVLPVWDGSTGTGGRQEGRKRQCRRLLLPAIASWLS